MKKDEFRFWQGLYLGILGGFLGNMLVALMMRYMDKPSNSVLDAFVIMVASIVFVLFLAAIENKIGEYRNKK
jgi:H+/Cl- antiporter ClcA